MILLRHGQSLFNLHFDATGLDPGHPDPPLTALGVRQAEAAAAALAHEGVGRILCSPYTRALQTARVVSMRLGVPVSVSAQVRERRSASCDIGTARSALAAAWPGLDFVTLDEVWWPDADEDEEAFGARAAAFLEAMRRHPEWGRTLVVCHWGVILALTGRSVGNGEWLRCEGPRGSPGFSHEP